MSDILTPTDPAIVEPAATIAAPPLSYFEKLKGFALKAEQDAMAELHAIQLAALADVHSAITDVEGLISYIRSKL